MSPALDPDACYRAVSSRDARFDGVFWTGVRSTGIYCRPSCPARTPARERVTFHPSAAAAQAAGYRACRRCLPDAVPGSPAWNVEADVAARAQRLIDDGVVDREGVEGLADRLGFTTRHLHRVVAQRLGAGPLALARARRARLARVLIEASALPLADVAFAAGFGSVRQFNGTLREVYDASPSDLRAAARRGSGPEVEPAGERGGAMTLDLRVAVRTPFAASALLDFLAFHVVEGLERVRGTRYLRTVVLPHGPAVVAVDLAQQPAFAEPGTARVPVRVRLADPRDAGVALERCRRLLDADADAVAIDAQLADDAVLAPLIARRPGLRVPGALDADELAVRAVIGQQVGVRGACTVTARVVAEHGEPLPAPLAVDPALTHTFPTAGALAEAAPETLPMPRSRGRALVGLAAALRDGDVRLDGGTPRPEVDRALCALWGIGPWTAGYVALRALGDPDVWLTGDLAIRRAVEERGLAAEHHRRWSPWRSYALLHLWHGVIPAHVPVAGESEEP